MTNSRRRQHKRPAGAGGTRCGQGRKCNSEKRDRLANIHALTRLCARNAAIYPPTYSFGRRLPSAFCGMACPGIYQGAFEQAAADGFPRRKDQGCSRMTTVKTIWDSFCAAHRIAIDSVPLFASDKQGFVETKEIGIALKRKVLVRHRDMENLILRETDILIDDWRQRTCQYDGLIYMMHRRNDDGCLVPLYIGKAETIGRGDGNLSANLRDLHKRKDKFARWGDNYAYHIGDLSAAALTNHPVEKRNPKCIQWASKIFNSTPTDRPQLAFDLYFWANAWERTDVGIWAELSPTRLAFLEYLLIGVASTVFNGSLLNYEGRNRLL
jgi:hypothetical protein